MGKVASLVYSLQEGRAVFLRGFRKKFIYEGSQKSKPAIDELLGRDLYISYFYPDLVVEKVEVPPVEDEETLHALLGKRLGEITGSSTEFLICKWEIEEEATSEARVYRVFGLPKEVYENPEILPEVLKERVGIFTVAQFSPAGISLLIDSELTIFHVYLDEERLLLTVSRGGEILYSRSLSVPGYAREMGDLAGFLHENTNMTYVFVAQRQGIKLDLILISGKAKDEDSFIAGLLEMTSVPVATPLPPKEVKGLDPDPFHDFLPAFGTLFLDEDYDFSPSEVKERRRFLKYSSVLIPALFIIFLLFTGALAFRTLGIVDRISDLSQKRDRVAAEVKRLLSKPLVARGELGYYSSYLNDLYRARKENPVYILSDAGDVVKKFRAKRYVLGFQGGKVALAVEIERTFSNLVEMNLFVESVKTHLEKLKERGFEIRLGDVNKDLEKNTVKMSFMVEKRV